MVHRLHQVQRVCANGAGNVLCGGRNGVREVCGRGDGGGGRIAVSAGECTGAGGLVASVWLQPSNSERGRPTRRLAVLIAPPLSPGQTSYCIRTLLRIPLQILLFRGVEVLFISLLWIYPVLPDKWKNNRFLCCMVCYVNCDFSESLNGRNPSVDGLTSSSAFAQAQSQKNKQASYDPIPAKVLTSCVFPRDTCLAQNRHQC